MTTDRPFAKRKWADDSKEERVSKYPRTQTISEEKTSEDETSDMFFRKFDEFVKLGLIYLEGYAYSQFWELLDYYRDRISDYDFTYYEYYTGIENFISFLINSRKKRIQSGETNRDRKSVV